MTIDISSVSSAIDSIRGKYSKYEDMNNVVTESAMIQATSITIETAIHGKGGYLLSKFIIDNMSRITFLRSEMPRDEAIRAYALTVSEADTDRLTYHDMQDLCIRKVGMYGLPIEDEQQKSDAAILIGGILSVWELCLTKYDNTNVAVYIWSYITIHRCNEAVAGLSSVDSREVHSTTGTTINAIITVLGK